MASSLTLATAPVLVAGIHCLGSGGSLESPVFSGLSMGHPVTTLQRSDEVLEGLI